MKKNLITVLKKLLAAFGGEDTQSNNAVEVIDKIADAANSDRRPLILKFATVNPFTVTTPIADIKAAIDAGRQVYFDHEGSRLVFVGWYITNGNLYSIEFAATSYDDTGLASAIKVNYVMGTGWHYSEM